MKFRRIILDGVFPHKERYSYLELIEVLAEGHVIRNPQSITSISVRALTAKHKWIVSGTPLHK